jgi:hypothetical protein
VRGTISASASSPRPKMNCSGDESASRAPGIELEAALE